MSTPLDYLPSGKIQDQGERPPAAKRHRSCRTRCQSFEVNNRKNPTVMANPVPGVPYTMENPTTGDCALCVSGTSWVRSHPDPGTATHSNPNTRTCPDTGSDVSDNHTSSSDSIVSEIQDMTISQRSEQYSFIAASTAPPTARVHTSRRRCTRRSKNGPSASDSSTATAPATTTAASTTTAPSTSRAATLGPLPAPAPSTSNDSSCQAAVVGATNAPVMVVRRVVPFVVPSVVPSVGLNWANPFSLWSVMTQKELRYQHSPALLEDHPDISPRNRAMVLEWLMEICQLEDFMKETYYLSQDIFDRLLANSRNMALNKLQLAGTTALFIAAKVEEKTAPYAGEYADLTDGCCSEQDITDFEVIILKALDWKVTPATVITWLTFQLQLMVVHQSGKTWLDVTEEDMTRSLYSKTVFTYACRLLDLCMLDVRSLEFKYSVLAACAAYNSHPDTEAFLDIVLPCVDQLQFWKCQTWMMDFVEVVSKASPLAVAPASSVLPAERHLLQRLTVDLNMLDAALGINRR